MKRYISELTLLVDRKLFIFGVTRHDAAEMAGITNQYLNNLLTSKALPSAEVSDALANIIDEKPEKLRKLMLKCYEKRKAERLQQTA